MQVECRLRELGYTAEADWCEVLREAYRAVDEQGLAVHERLMKLLNLRLGDLGLLFLPLSVSYIQMC